MDMRFTKSHSVELGFNQLDPAVRTVSLRGQPLPKKRSRLRPSVIGRWLVALGMVVGLGVISPVALAIVAAGAVVLLTIATSVCVWTMNNTI